jgi:hypothetical protein
MHRMDIQVIALAEFTHSVNKHGKRNGYFIDFDQHDHGKIFLQHRLGNVHDVHIIFSTDIADFGDNSDGITADDTDYSFHEKTPCMTLI